MSIEGAHPQALEEVASLFDAIASTLIEIRIRLSGQIPRLRWTGPDARRYDDHWGRTVVPQIVAATESMSQLAGLLRVQAQQQLTASEESPANATATKGDTPPVGRLTLTEGRLPVDAGTAAARPTVDPVVGITFLRETGLDPGRQFLTYDPTGDGRAVEVFGDLMSAERIGIWVPGVGTTIADFDAPQTLGAKHIWDGAPEVAMIEWLGYDPPDTIVHAAVEMASGAGRAATDLNLFVDQLRTMLPDGHDRQIIIGGHSYGATVAANAAAAGTSADVLVLAGAPGVPTGTVEQMNLNGHKGSPRSVFVVANTVDPVRAGSLVDDLFDALVHAAVGVSVSRPLSMLVGSGHPGGHTLWSRMHTDPTSAAFGATRLPSGPTSGAGASEMIRSLRNAHEYTVDNPRALESIRQVYANATPRDDRTQP